MGAQNRSMPELPKDCIEKILSFTAPREACRLSIVSSTFEDAALSDTVWEKFLPPDYHSIVSNSSSSLLLQDLSSKKQLYLSLSDNPILINNGEMSFSLEKWSGKKCYMISARELRIAWRDDARYWRWNSDTNSRFAENVQLLLVCWLDIGGKIDTRMLSTKTLYGGYLVFKLSQRTYGFEHPPIKIGVGLADSVTEYRRSVHLDFGNIGRDGVVKERRDGWLEIELGEFFNTEGEDGELEMSLMEVECLNSKRGLIVQGMEIRPKIC